MERDAPLRAGQRDAVEVPAVDLHPDEALAGAVRRWAHEVARTPGIAVTALEVRPLHRPGHLASPRSRPAAVCDGAPRMNLLLWPQRLQATGIGSTVAS